MARLVLFVFSTLCFFTATGQGIVPPLSAFESGERIDLMGSFSQPIPDRFWLNADTADRWKEWELVENYSFGKNRGQIPMISDLQSLHPYFRDQVIALLQLCREKGIEVAVVETYRTPTKQNEYRSMGRRYTRSSGGLSKHQYGLAVDLVPMKDSVAQWNNIVLWRKIGVLGERLGLRWGGRWRRPFDPGHFEWTGGVGTYHLTRGNFPGVPKANLYPCIDDDLKELRSHWRFWEAEQAALRRKQPATATSRLTAKQVQRVGEE